MIEQKQEKKFLVDIFSSLGNNVRLLILSEVMKKNVRTSEILEKTDISIQALHKQITHLVKNGLVHKHDGIISITEFGRTIAGQIPTLEFLIEHEEYFQNHSIKNLPLRYIQSIGVLRNCHQVHDTVNVLEKKQSIIHNSKVSLKITIVQYSLEVAQHIVDRLNQGGITLQYIMGENTIIPKGRKEFLKKAAWNKWVEDGTIRRKMIKNVALMIVLSEEESLIAFPDNNNTVHMNSGFYSKDKIFHEWCEHLFDDIWNISGHFDEKKIRE